MNNAVMATPPADDAGDTDDVFIFPTSFAQRRLWFLDQLEPDSALYNLSAAVRLRGRLDTGALTGTLQEIVARHESLRTTFTTVDGEPVQVIRAELATPLPLTDLSMLPPPAAEAQVAALAREEAFLPFSLARGPLIRACLLRVSTDDHVLLFTLHHIVSDGWSMGVLFKEVAAIYSALVRGQPSPLPELPIQYADFAQWQRTTEGGRKLTAALAFWTGALKDAPSLLTLPWDRPRPAVQRYRGASLQVAVPADVTAALTALGRRHQATLFMSLTSAFGVLLGRYAGQADVCIGTPIANRNRVESTGLIGFFVNTLVLRVQPAADQSFETLLAGVRDHALHAFAHQDLPFEQLVEALRPQRSTSHAPLFQAMLVLQNTPMGSLELPGLTLLPVEVAGEVAKFDLTLSVTESADGLLCAFEYATDLFDASTVQRMAGHFVRLLGAVVAAPHTPLRDIGLMDDDERRQVLTDWNDTAMGYDRGDTLHGRIERQVLRTPNAPALRFEGRTLSYAELDATANRLAHQLRACGVGPDDRVAVCAERSFEMVVALLGTLKAGAAYVPLDPSLPPARLAAMVTDARAAVLLKTPDTRALAASGLAAAGRPHLEIDLARDGLPDTDPGAPVSGVQPAHLAYVIYTSGSTGKPKGVAVTHEGVVNRLQWMQQAYGLQPGECVLQKTPYGFDVSVWEFFWTLAEGATLVLARPGGQLDPVYLARLIDDENVGTVHFVPPLLDVFLGEMPDGTGRSLRRVICSGQALPLATQDRCLARWPGASLYNLYGPTEASVDVSAWTCLPNRTLASVPIGWPIANIQLYVLDETLAPVPPGVAGQLHIAGIGLARGYLHRPDLTAAAFVPDPFGAPGQRMYRTGDLARHLPDGAIDYLGRIDHQVKMRGLRIELGEIETALAALPDVRQACVLLREDMAGDPRLVAYLVADEGQAAPSDIGAVRAALAAGLPAYMLPSDVVCLAAWPLTPNGKIDRKALPAPQNADSAARRVAPRTPTEAALAAIWRAVLRTDDVGVEDDFFQLGGHSLLATQVMAQLRAAMQVELPLRGLFEAPTIAQLARRVESLRGRPDASPAQPPLSPAPRDRPLPLAFAQQRLWFLDRLDPGNTAYNVPLAVRLSGRLYETALALALQQVVDRHEALRTHFGQQDGDAVQQIEATLQVPLPLTDLGALAPTEREADARRRARDDAGTPFDLATGPLIRARLLRLADNDHLLLLTLHHIVADGWALRVLIDELVQLYRAAAAGQPSPLETPRLQYADYAFWQRGLLQGAALQAELDFWCDRLAGAPDVMPLPLDRPRATVRGTRAAAHAFSLPAPLADGLRALCRRTGCTLFVALLTGFQVLLHRRTGATDLMIGADVANRNRAETAQMIGFFVNQIVVRAQVNDNPRFASLLAQTHDAVLDAQSHQDVPFDKVVEALRPRRSQAWHPLFQVKIAYQNVGGVSAEVDGLSLTLEPQDTEAGKECDLTLFLTEATEGLDGLMAYNPDLFDAATIAGLMRDYASLLADAMARPETRLDRLQLAQAVTASSARVARAPTFSSPSSPEATSMQETTPTRALPAAPTPSKFQKFKAAKPQPVAVADMVSFGSLAPGRELPLVIEPAVPDLDLAEWAAANRAMIEARLQRHGAVLFRGFGIDTPAAMERFTAALCHTLYAENGEHPHLSGRVYEPVFFPATEKLLWHNENTFNQIFPRYIWFACIQPAEQGGETPMVDSRAVYHTVDPDVRTRFHTRGVRYVRNYRRGIGLSWQEVFGTVDRARVEAMCRESQMDWEWKADDHLRTSCVRPGVGRHPGTGEWIWINQAQHWHVSCLDLGTREALRNLCSEEDLPRHCYYGDGSPIADSDMQHILQVYGQLETSFSWRPGDVVMLDNVLTAHARNPYVGKRKLMVTLGDMMAMSDLLDSRQP